jgi:hypothetical protein
MASDAYVPTREDHGRPPGGDPPYPPVSACAGLIAKTAIVSGPDMRTRAVTD